MLANTTQLADFKFAFPKTLLLLSQPKALFFKRKIFEKSNSPVRAESKPLKSLLPHESIKKAPLKK